MTVPPLIQVGSRGATACYTAAIGINCSLGSAIGVDKLTQSLAGSPDRPAVQNLARAFGVDATEVQKVIETVAPEMSRELERLTLSRGNLAELIGLFGRNDYEDALQDADAVRRPETQAAGLDVLAKIFGTKHKSRVVAQRASQSSHVPPETIKGMLPSIGAMFMGELKRQTREPLRQAAVSSPFGQGREDPFANQQPLPVPGETASRGRVTRNPYEDFSDVVRRNGGGVSRNGSLSNVLRDLLGSVLGFRSNGIVSWIIKMVLARYGMQILRFLLGRVFGR